jgi:hypothetical protein
MLSVAYAAPGSRITAEFRKNYASEKNRETCGGLSIYNFLRNWSDDSIHFNRPQEPHLHASEFWFPHITREQVKPKSCEFINI